MQPVLNIEDVRAVELALDDAGVSLAELMQRAGVAAADELLRFVHPDTPDCVVVLAGYGNNGGDGWVAAERLLSQGVEAVVVTPLAPRDIRSDLARDAAVHAATAGVPYAVDPDVDQLLDLFASADVVLDAILGTGFRGTPREPFSLWIELLNELGCPVVSVDVPSGLSAQTGHADGACVRADLTVTMIALKPGLLSDEGRDLCGNLVVAPLDDETEDLAQEVELLAWRLDPEDYAEVLAPRSSSVDKFSRGSVLVVGGSSRYVGAPIMAAMAAARAGAGYVTLAVPETIAPTVQAHMLEIPVVALPATEHGTIAPEAADLVEKLALRNTATLVGPGMRANADVAQVVARLLAADVPLVVDADGLNCLALLSGGSLDEHGELLRRTNPVILTPHRGELGRLVDGGSSMPGSLPSMVEAARRVVWASGGSELVVVAKGSASACVGVEAAVLPKPGPAALATAGSGDVLGGIMASLLAQTQVSGENLPLLAALACEVHGEAGNIAAERYGSRGVMARDVINAVGIAHDTLYEQVSLAGLDMEF